MGILMRQAGGLSRVYTEVDRANLVYVTITGGLAGVLQGSAPASGITIQQSVDSTINKALLGDYFINAFGFSPVTISIKGMDLYRRDCAGGYSIKGFFNDNNAYDNPYGRFYVSFVGGDSNVVFNCVLISLTTSANASTGESCGVGDYTLLLTGVKV